MWYASSMTNSKKLSGKRENRRQERKSQRASVRAALSGARARLVQSDHWNRRPERPEPPLFTGSCPVRQHTADGDYVGRCCHSTYDGLCHLHGDVSQWLVEGADLTDADDRRIPR
jgi:hypothetical protein